MVGECEDVVHMEHHRYERRTSEMTDIQQLERGIHNIDAHGPFCECLLCHEKGVQSVGMQTDSTNKMEQELMAMLRDLPLDINITRQKSHEGEEYRWRCLEASGQEASFVEATREALQSMVGVLQTQ